MPNRPAIPRRAISLKFDAALLDQVDAQAGPGGRTAWLEQAARAALSYQVAPAAPGVRRPPLPATPDATEVSPRFKKGHQP